MWPFHFIPYFIMYHFSQDLRCGEATWQNRQLNLTLKLVYLARGNHSGRKQGNWEKTYFMMSSSSLLLAAHV